MNDASLATAFEEQRRFVLSEIEKVEYGELTGRAAVQTVSEGGRGSSTVRQYVLDRAGVMKLRSSKGDDLNLIDISGSFVDAPIFLSESGFEHHIDEVWAIAETGMNLDTTKAEATMEAYEEMVNRIIWVGDTDVGLTGLANNANVTVDTAGAALSTLTAQQVVEFFKGLYNAVTVNTKGKVRPNTLAMDIETHNFLTDNAYAVVNGVTNQSILDRIVEIIPGMTMSDVIVAPELDAQGAGGIKRAVFYDRSPRRVKFNEPLPIEFQPTQRIKNNFIVPTVAKVGGVWVKYPNSMTYGDYTLA